MANLKKSIFTFLLAMFASVTFAGDQLEFQRLDLPAAASSVADGKPLLLYIGLTNCGFCRRLEAEVMPALLETDEYQSQILVQKVLWDSQTPVAWKDGESKTPDQIARMFRLRATPTLLFLDADGNEIGKRIEGYRDASFFWSYLDDSIEEARLALAK